MWRWKRLLMASFLHINSKSITRKNIASAITDDDKVWRRLWADVWKTKKVSHINILRHPRKNILYVDNLHLPYVVILGRKPQSIVQTWLKKKKGKKGINSIVWSIPAAKEESFTYSDLRWTPRQCKQLIKHNPPLGVNSNWPCKSNSVYSRNQCK